MTNPNQAEPLNQPAYGDALTPIEVERLLERIRMKAGNNDGYLIRGHVDALTAWLDLAKLADLLTACERAIPACLNTARNQSPCRVNVEIAAALDAFRAPGAAS